LLLVDNQVKYRTIFLYGGGRRSAFHDVSMIMRIDLRKDLRDVFVSGKVVRATLVRTTAKASVYEVALHFYSWANLSGANVQCYRVRDDSVPPLAAWITRKQLSRK
jgi:hypothetical protein